MQLEQAIPKATILLSMLEDEIKRIMAEQTQTPDVTSLNHEQLFNKGFQIIRYCYSIEKDAENIRKMIYECEDF